MPPISVVGSAADSFEIARVSSMKGGGSGYSAMYFCLNQAPNSVPSSWLPQSLLRDRLLQRHNNSRSPRQVCRLAHLALVQPNDPGTELFDELEPMRGEEKRFPRSTDLNKPVETFGLVGLVSYPYRVVCNVDVAVEFKRSRKSKTGKHALGVGRHRLQGSNPPCRQNALSAPRVLRLVRAEILETAPALGDCEDHSSSD